MKFDTYTTAGKAGKSVELSEIVFGQKWNADLVHQVIVSSRSNLRKGLAHTKDRSEVSGTGKKPWRQKGSGKARHGSRRSPIWIGGGVAFGPTNEKNYTKKINKKMKNKALALLLSAKVKNDNVLFVESFDLKETKTKAAFSNLENLAKAKGFETINTLSNKNNILMVVPEVNDILKKSLKNLPHVTLVSAQGLNPLTCANARYVLVVNPSEVNAILEARLKGDYKSKFVATATK